MLNAYPLILKNKGNKLGIQYAINTFVKIKNIKTEISVTVDNETHTINIFTEENITDLGLLVTLLQHVLPTGYVYKQSYFTSDVSQDTIYLGERLTTTII